MSALGTSQPRFPALTPTPPPTPGGSSPPPHEGFFSTQVRPGTSLPHSWPPDCRYGLNPEQRVWDRNRRSQRTRFGEGGWDRQSGQIICRTDRHILSSLESLQGRGTGYPGPPWPRGAGGPREVTGRGAHETQLPGTERQETALRVRFPAAALQARSPLPGCPLTRCPIQPAAPGQGHVVSVYRWGFSNTAGS